MVIKIFCLLFLITINLFGQNKISKEFVGDWVGSGWGWEVRFKQSAGEFAKQFTKGKFNLPFENEKIIMSLMVTHTTHYYFSVHEDGNVTGKGIITYDLIPNLCGLAALTQQVNERINLMNLIPSIFKWASELGRNAVQNFNSEWYEEQNKFAMDMKVFQNLTKRYSKIKPNTEEAKQLKTNFLDWIKNNTLNEDIRRMAAALVTNRCGQGTHIIGTGLNCASLLARTFEEVELKSWKEIALEELMNQIMGELSEHYNDAMKSIAEKSEMGEELCRCGAGISVNAGAKYGPTTIEELVRELGPDVATTLMFDVALGSPPTGLVLSIPGVTQVQYYYKGLINGPENRYFDIKGKLTGNGLILEIDGDVKGGDKDLTIEYMVNYKKERAKFPCWAPFLNEPADVYSSGEETLYEYVTIQKKLPIKDEKTGKITEVTVPEKQTKMKKVLHELPFATFHKTGTHRNNKSMWHEYEYTWRAYKLTTPLTEEEIKTENEKQKEKERKEKFIKEKSDELKNNGETDFEIPFTPGQSTVEPNSQSQVDNIYEVIKNFPNHKFSIAVCCDTTADKNLSIKRANSILNSIIKKGIKKSQIQIAECSLSMEDKYRSQSGNNACVILSINKK
ncbi:MAG: OmpA family protein [Ignavibacterium sp.]